MDDYKTTLFDIYGNYFSPILADEWNSGLGFTAQNGRIVINLEGDQFNLPGPTAGSVLSDQLTVSTPEPATLLLLGAGLAGLGLVRRRFKS